jgi:hypothetical protein
MVNKRLSILDRFPAKSDRISSLMAENPDFLGVCEDHEECVKALRHWADSQEPEAPNRVDEYRNLIQELEEEILGAIDEERT